VLRFRNYGDVFFDMRIISNAHSAFSPGVNKYVSVFMNRRTKPPKNHIDYRGTEHNGSLLSKIDRIRCKFL